MTPVSPILWRRQVLLGVLDERACAGVRSFVATLAFIAHMPELADVLGSPAKARSMFADAVMAHLGDRPRGSA